MIINHNLSAINANRHLNMVNSRQIHTISQLSSGLRITRAADDAAGLAVSERMRAQIRGTNQAVRNANDGISFVQTAEGFLQGTTEALQRMRELAVQAANGIYSEFDRASIQAEVDQLFEELNRIAEQSQFNGLTLFDGSFSNNGGIAASFHIGANMDQRIGVNLNDMSVVGLGLAGAFGEGGVSVATADNANSAIGMLDGALMVVTRERANLGAFQNRLELLVNSQMNASQNMQFSESQIRDLDMAGAMVDLMRENILMQASMAMLAQANQRSQMVLSLLN
ncbi:MAG: flagellin [Spirochaetaceae bacterium]|nr:flagellin [Spirochaetaceae bacterium]